MILCLQIQQLREVGINVQAEVWSQPGSNTPDHESSAENTSAATNAAQAGFDTTGTGAGRPGRATPPAHAGQCSRIGAEAEGGTARRTGTQSPTEQAAASCGADGSSSQSTPQIFQYGQVEARLDDAGVPRAHM